LSSTSVGFAHSVERASGPVTDRPKKAGDQRVHQPYCGLNIWSQTIDSATSGTRIGGKSVR
jgi:hypothetical protein